MHDRSGTVQNDTAPHGPLRTVAAKSLQRSTQIQAWSNFCGLQFALSYGATHSINKAIFFTRLISQDM